MTGSRALAAVLLLAVAAATAAAADADADACPRAAWRSLPLATKPATLDQLDINDWQTYIKSSLVPHLIGAAVATGIALILLLSWLAWRAVKICCGCCCACARGPQVHGNKARKLLAGKGSRCLKALAFLASAGVLAGALWGISQVDAALIDPGLTAVAGLTGFVRTAVAAGHSTITAVNDLDAALMDQSVRGDLVDLAAALAAGGDAAGAATLSSYAIDSTHTALAGFSSLGSNLDDIQAKTADVIDSNIDEFRPTMVTADKWRANALYIVYGVTAGLAAFVCFGILIDLPAWAKPWVLLLLILVLLAWIVNLALTAVLRAGNDVCVNLAGKATELMADNVSLGGSGDSAALITYYLTGTGGGVLEVVKDTMDIDVADKLAEADATLAQLKAAISATPALASMGDSLDNVEQLLTAVKASIDALVAELSYDAFHPVYAALKGYVCCTVLNSIGATWLGLVISCSFALLLLLFAFSWVGRMDKLQQQACCHIYSARDYSLEGSGGGDGSQFITGGTSGGKVDPLLAPPSPSAMVARKAAQQAALSPADGGMGIKASRVAPAPASPLYPAVGAPLPPPAAIAFPQPSAPSEADLQLEAQRAAALAGEAFRMASQAQNLLDAVARTGSRLGTAGASGLQPGSPGGAGYGVAPQPWGAAP